MLIRSTPFPAPLSAEAASELSEILGRVVAVSAETAAYHCGLSVSFLIARSTSSTAQDAIIGEFLMHNTAGKSPAESAFRTAAWLTSTLVQIARETEERMS